ncbi:MAG: hypothetical protein P8Y60_07560 [Calditrichota bacterium]|jgi:hypothetical protein
MSKLPNREKYGFGWWLDIYNENLFTGYPPYNEQIKKNIQSLFSELWLRYCNEYYKFMPLQITQMISGSLGKCDYTRTQFGRKYGKYIFRAA